MPWLPKPYPDEVIGSVFARACRHSGLPLSAMARVVSGRPTKPSFQSFFMAVPISRIALMSGTAPSALVFEHSVLPYAVAFMSPAQQTQLFEKALNKEDDECLGSLTKNVSHSVSVRRLCQRCVEADLLAFGESYWRRSHLLPATFVCLQHQEPLLETNIAIRTIRWPSLLPHEVVKEAREPNLGLERRVLVALAELARDALFARIPARSDWRAHYREQALAVGYGHKTQEVAAAKLSADLAAYFGDALLESVRYPRSNTGLLSWPKLMVKPCMPAPFATVKHILMQTMLNDPASFGGGRYRPKRPGKVPTHVEAMDAGIAERLKILAARRHAQGRTINVGKALERLDAWKYVRHQRRRMPLTSAAMTAIHQANLAGIRSGALFRRRRRRRLKVPVAKTAKAPRP